MVGWEKSSLFNPQLIWWQPPLWTAPGQAWVKMGGGDLREDRVLSPELSRPQTLLSLGIVHAMDPLCCSVTKSCNSFYPMHCSIQAFLSFTISWILLKLISTESVILSNHLILCHSLLLMLSVLPSIRVFFSELILCIRWPKYWRFSFSISSSNEYLELISFRIDWFDLLAVQETEAQFEISPAQFESTNSLVLSLLYGPTLTSTHDYWKNHSFDSACKVMSLFFNTLPRSFIAFLPSVF